MATEKQIAANRRNAAKSTGPRTQQGKARSKMNALRHGFAVPTWRGGVGSIGLCSGPASLEVSYTKLATKRLDIEQEKARLLGQVDKILAGGETRDIARLLQRAAALERYERPIGADVRRLLKQAQRSHLVEADAPSERLAGSKARLPTD